MAITLQTPDGTITADTPEELARYQLAMKQVQASAAPSTTTSTATAVASRPAPQNMTARAALNAAVTVARHARNLDHSGRQEANLATTATFLSAIGSGEAAADAVRAALGVQGGPRAMGGKIQAVKGVLKQVGIERSEQVFYQDRSAPGSPWRAGPQHSEALTKVMERLEKAK